MIELNLNFEGWEIVKLKGEFLEHKSLFLEPRTYKGRIVYHKLTTIKVEGQFILVNQGFTKKKEKEN